MPDPDSCRFERVEQRHGASGLTWALGGAACAAGLIATLLPLRQLLALSELPRGTPIRPMVLGGLWLLSAVLSLLIVAPLAAACLFTGWRTRAGKVLGILGLLLAAYATFGIGWLLGGSSRPARWS